MGDLFLGIAGAFAVSKFGDKVPVSDPRLKAALLVGVGVLGATKGPKEMRPLFMGAATYAGLVGINAVMAGMSGGGDAPIEGIGRLSANRGAQLRAAVAQGMNARRLSASMNGRINGSINGSINAVGRGSIFNR